MRKSVWWQTAQRAWGAYTEWDADALVYETNFGKDWLTEVLKRVWEETHGPLSTAPLKPVTAVKGKQLRAQPMAMRYEQGRVHMVGEHPALEDELCTWVPEESRDSPDRVDAMVHGHQELVSRERAVVTLALPKHARRTPSR